MSPSDRLTMAEDALRHVHAAVRLLRLKRMPSYKPAKRRLVRRCCVDAWVEGAPYVVA